LKQIALIRFARDGKGTVIISLKDVLRGFKDDLSLGPGSIMARKAVITQDWEDFLLEVDGFVAFDFVDLQAFGSNRLGDCRDRSEKD